MEIHLINQALEDSRASISQLSAPAKPGVYAIYWAGDDLENSPFQNGAIVYIGSSSNLNAREFDHHFDSGNTGFSTLRRSFGALLKEPLQLKAIPRSAGSKPTVYSFENDGDDRLTNWMRENLQIGVYQTEDYDSVEKALIEAHGSVLNLTGWDNPYRKMIKQLRKVCADEVRRQMQ